MVANASSMILGDFSYVTKATSMMLVAFATIFAVFAIFSSLGIGLGYTVDMTSA